MRSVSPRRQRARRWLVRSAVALGCALTLGGCVVYPAGGYYGHPHPYYYGGGYYGYRPGWR